MLYRIAGISRAGDGGGGGIFSKNNKYRILTMGCENYTNHYCNTINTVYAKNLPLYDNFYAYKM